LIKYLLRRQRQEGEQRAKARYMRRSWGRGGSRQERAAARNSPHPTGKPNAWHFKKYRIFSEARKYERHGGMNKGQGYITPLCLVSSGKLFGARIAAFCKRRDK
jgi:hypothetical protein